MKVQNKRVGTTWRKTLLNQLVYDYKSRNSSRDESHLLTFHLQIGSFHQIRSFKRNFLLSAHADSTLKRVDKFTNQEGNVSSTKTDLYMRLAKAWTAIDSLSVIWKSDLTDKLKRSFFQAAIVSMLLYGCTTWMLTKRIEKKLGSNCTRMLRAMLNKSWRQHPIKQQLYGHQSPITKTVKIRRTRHVVVFIGVKLSKQYLLFLSRF